jgi:hypothetical protein
VRELAVWVWAAAQDTPPPAAAAASPLGEDQLSALSDRMIENGRPPAPTAPGARAPPSRAAPSPRPAGGASAARRLQLQPFLAWFAALRDHLYETRRAAAAAQGAQGAQSAQGAQPPGVSPRRLVRGRSQSGQTSPRSRGVSPQRDMLPKACVSPHPARRPHPAARPALSAARRAPYQVLDVTPRVSPVRDLHLLTPRAAEARRGGPERPAPVRLASGAPDSAHTARSSAAVSSDCFTDLPLVAPVAPAPAPAHEERRRGAAGEPGGPTGAAGPDGGGGAAETSFDEKLRAVEQSVMDAIDYDFRDVMADMHRAKHRFAPGSPDRSPDRPPRAPPRALSGSMLAELPPDPRGPPPPRGAAAAGERADLADTPRDRRLACAPTARPRPRPRASGAPALKWVTVYARLPAGACVCSLLASGRVCVRSWPRGALCPQLLLRQVRGAQCVRSRV